MFLKLIALSSHPPLHRGPVGCASPSGPCVCVLVAQWYPTLCEPIDYSPPGSSVHGISQARILE